MNSLIQLRQTTSVFCVALGLTCFALSRSAEAVTPAPDGGYPNQNTAEGTNALLTLTTGVSNTAIGFGSLRSITIQNNNTAIGAGTLANNTNSGNTASGAFALHGNTVGHQNTAAGAFALYLNQVAFDNTAVGSAALSNNDSTGNGLAKSNTAVGTSVLASNVDGHDNTAVGASALFANTDSGNTAVGSGALSASISRLLSRNGPDTAVGFEALSGPDTGGGNVAIGGNLPGITPGAVLASNTAGTANTAIGNGALRLNTIGSWNTAVGAGSLIFNVVGNDNVAIGVNAGAAITGESNTDIGTGAVGVAGENNTIRIADNLPTTPGVSQCFIGGIVSNATGALPAVTINTVTNKLGVFTSSARFKKDIKPMDKASESIFALKPVTFRYKNDANGVLQFGLVAEEVVKVNPDLVTLDRDGKPFSVSYPEVSMMVLNEFLKEHRKVEQLEATVAKQQKNFQKEIQSLARTVKDQAAQIQKVSAQLEVSKSAPQTVLNNR